MVKIQKHYCGQMVKIGQFWTWIVGESQDATQQTIKDGTIYQFGMIKMMFGDR